MDDSPPPGVGEAAQQLVEITAALQNATTECGLQRARADAAEAREQDLISSFEDRIRRALVSHTALEKEVAAIATPAGYTPGSYACITPPTRPAGAALEHVDAVGSTAKAAGEADASEGTRIQYPSAEAENVFLHVENQGLKDKLKSVRELLASTEQAVEAGVQEVHAERQAQFRLKDEWQQRLADAERRHAEEMEAKDVEAAGRLARALDEDGAKARAAEDEWRRRLLEVEDAHAEKVRESEALAAAARDEASALSSEVATLRDEAAAHAADRTELEGELKIARAEAGALKVVAYDKGVLEEEIQETKLGSDRLRTNLAELTGTAKASDAQICDLKEEIATLKEQARAAGAERARLQALVLMAEADAAMAKPKAESLIEAAQQERDGRAAEAEVLQAEVEQLKERVEGMAREAAAAKKAGGVVRVERQALADELGDTKHALRLANQHRDAALVKITTLEDSNHTMSALVDDLTQQVRFFDAQCSSVAEMNERLSANAAVSQNLVDFADANASLKTALAAAKEKIAGLKVVCKSNAGEITTLKIRADGAEALDKRLRISHAHAQEITLQVQERDKQLQQLAQELRSERERSAEALHALAAAEEVAGSAGDLASFEPGPQYWDQAQVRGAVAEGDWVVRNRRELATTLWEMFRALQNALKQARARAHPPGLRSTNPVMDLRNAVKDLDYVGDHVRDAKDKAHWVIANYLTDVEKLHLGIPVGSFIADLDNGRAGTRDSTPVYVPTHRSQRSPSRRSPRKSMSPANAPASPPARQGPVPQWAQDLVREHATLPGVAPAEKSLYLRSLSPRSNRSASPVLSRSGVHAAGHSPAVEQLLEKYDPWAHP
eukprot:TRINITY_DN27633_c0_g1_i1.p1 TRINITY_DN27633_c0_g1~~TRINITY_DN27633_c0_g1_i1.p1  ORF type:complete len:844 (+),score=248.05 TRINITY_DN27633_c0_g1_i1:63-2594(+)